MYNRQIMADRLRKARLDKAADEGHKLTQEDVSAATGVSRAHIANAEGARTGISLDAAHALSEFYEIPLDYLVGKTSVPVSVADDFAKNDDERRLLDAWRSISEEDRGALKIALRNAVRAQDSNAA
ncbi:helix-turn-helix domain-containing protein [Acetobacter sp.]|uniref:helix-turn-helix domain-containing protein n=1 Tax=Acetobacter sp. TaxID=440 RepID=UPI0039ED2222